MSRICPQFFNWNDPIQNATQLKESLLVFKFGILSEITLFVSFACLPLVLFKVLEPFGRQWAVVMVLFALLSIPTSLTNVSHKFDIVALASSLPESFDAVYQTKAQEIISKMGEYYNGTQISTLFWGLWLCPFGVLVFRSGFLPKTLGVLLVAGCFGYVITFVGKFMVPQFEGSLVEQLAGIPSSIGEIGICLWMLIMGNKRIRFFERKKEC